MKAYPVTIGFNNERVIGKLELIDGVEVNINQVFSLAGRILKSHEDENGETVIDEFELMSISLIPDRFYRPYNKQKHDN